MNAVIDTDFATLTQRHRRELHVHCYRMLGNYQEAEDHVQETFLRAWRSRETFEGDAASCLAVPDRHQRVPGHDQVAQAPAAKSARSRG